MQNCFYKWKIENKRIANQFSKELITTQALWCHNFKAHSCNAQKTYNISRCSEVPKFFPPHDSTISWRTMWMINLWNSTPGDMLRSSIKETYVSTRPRGGRNHYCDSSIYHEPLELLFKPIIRHFRCEYLKVFIVALQSTRNLECKFPSWICGSKTNRPRNASLVFNLFLSLTCAWVL